MFWRTQIHTHLTNKYPSSFTHIYRFIFFEFILLFSFFVAGMSSYMFQISSQFLDACLIEKQHK